MPQHAERARIRGYRARQTNRGHRHPWLAGGAVPGSGSQGDSETLSLDITSLTVDGQCWRCSATASRVPPSGSRG